MTVTAPRSTALHYLAAIVSTGAVLVLVHLLPSLATASDWKLIVKCEAEIIFAPVPGLVITLAFLWKRSLWIGILARFLTDVAGLLSAAATTGHHE